MAEARYFKTQDGTIITSKNSIDSNFFVTKYTEVDKGGKSLVKKKSAKNPKKVKKAGQKANKTSEDISVTEGASGVSKDVLMGEEDILMGKTSEGNR